MLKRPDTTADVLDSFEAARLLRVSEKTLRTLASRGEIPACRVGRAWRFDRELLLDFVRAMSRENISSPRGQ